MVSACSTDQRSIARSVPGSARQIVDPACRTSAWQVHRSAGEGYRRSMAEKTHELDAADRNSMSEGTFAFPRVRKEPLNDAKHVRNAIARFDQVKDVSDEERDEAFERIKKAAAKFGVEVSESKWQELGKP
ncbi:hypothetical protein GCM10010435_82040 [Winogradskya consettensis]|uniref:Uncharacterized protein n=2 Tax=Winogradskya consettensis TaxID=113560 RepID=A0A919SW26_9ACTN|nr:hypothetical protein Aco04nite_63620 [Actinoplanes consettensis]